MLLAQSHGLKVFIQDTLQPFVFVCLQMVQNSIGNSKLRTEFHSCSNINDYKCTLENLIDISVGGSESVLERSSERKPLAAGDTNLTIMLQVMPLAIMPLIML